MNVCPTRCSGSGASASRLTVKAPRRPRLAQLAFLTVAAFLIFSKVWSQQYVLWLLPLAVLARPRWGAFVAWQLAEVCYFFAFDGELMGASGNPIFPEGVFVLGATAAPGHAAGPLRIRGAGHHAPRARRGRWAYEDDPDGGIFDGATGSRSARADRRTDGLTPGRWRRWASDARRSARPRRVRRPSAQSRGEGRCRRAVRRRRPGVSTTTGALGSAHHRDDQLWIDLALAEVVVPVAAGVERVLRVVGVHQVDAAGDRLDPVDDVEQVLAAGVGVAGVEAEADAEVADRVPQPGERVEPPGARVVAARGVLDQDRQREAALSAACAKALRQLSKPTAGSSPLLTWPPCTIRPLAPTAAAASACWPAACGSGCGCGC